ncbi:MAG TPA: 50S ribosomal protein L5 [Candidatus Omnitrophota bacterium]|nr:50S ribosomal protein L5 [Candidatus Omnitrophota bacterium]HRK61331.1 50S ribosomal protein L5 [Candidatus Omnitrophota bacterium]
MATAQDKYTPRLKTRYKEEIAKHLQEEFGYKNSMQIPHIEKIVVNMGIKEGPSDIKILEQCAEELALITGQKPVVRRAKKAISAFKLRENSPIGLKVTLRKARMYEFLDRLINVAMPRIRDFQGFSDRSFDGRGNFSIGLTEQTVFPEVHFDKVKKVQGMDITFVTTANNNQEAKRLLELLGFPFKKR